VDIRGDRQQHASAISNGSPTASGYLRETLNRRARSLALLRPLFDLEFNKGRYPELGLNSHDLFRLTSAVLDVIITEMGGFQRGATYEQIFDAVLGQLRKIDQGTNGQRCDRVASFLLDALTNERMRDSFRLEYQHEALNGILVWSPLVFKLIELRDFDGTGEGRYVASAEAINIYLTSLSVELEGQQAADEAALRHFIQHGRLDEAELAARAALMRTIEYADRIRRALQSVERGVSDFDWIAEMLPRLDAARNHIEERMKAEESLVIEAERKIPEADSEGKRRLAIIVDQLDRASRQHNSLLNLVLGANRRFMDEHARQHFRPVALNSFPNPQSAILRPLLRLTLGEVDDWLQNHWSLLHPPSYRSLLDYRLTTKALLQPARELAPLGEFAIETELEEGRDQEPAFSDSTWSAFQSAYREMPERFRLSDCLDRLQSAENAARHLAVLQVGQWFESHIDDPSVEPVGAKFLFDGFYGDDVMVTKPV
jgi:hypothetical protein